MASTARNEAQPQSPDTPAATPHKTTPFTADQLLAAWDAYAEALRPNRPSICTLMEAIRPEPAADFVLRIPVENAMQEEMLKPESQALLNHLKRELSNTLISFRFEHVEPSQRAQSNKLYTQGDKLRDMASRNPLISTLQERLDLQIE